MKKIVGSGIIIMILLVANFFYALTTSKNLAIYNEDISSDKYRTVGQMAENTVVTQTFKSKDKGLSAVEIMFSTYDRENNTVVEYQINNTNGTVVAEGSIDGSDLEHYKFYKINFKRINDSNNKIFKITLKDKNTAAGSAITILTTRETQPNDLSVAGNYSESIAETETLVMKVVNTNFDVETFIVLCSFELFIYAFIRIIYKFLR